MGSYVVYSRHNCNSAHRTYATAARCIWSKSRHEIDGEGPYVVTEKFWCKCCSYTFQHTLYPTQAEAEEELAALNARHERGQCCGSCTRTADLIILSASVATGVKKKESA